MKGTVLYGPRDIRFEDRDDPKILEPTDAVIRMAVTCVCGSDLWPYRGVQAIDGPTPMGHEYCGFVEEVGSAVKSVKPGPVRSGLVRDVGQRVSALPLRVPIVMRAARVYVESAGAVPAGAAG